MNWLSGLLSLLGLLAEGFILWMKRKPQATLTEKLLERRKKVLEAQYDFARLIGKGDSHEIRKKLDDLRGRIESLKLRRKSEGDRSDTGDGDKPT